MTRRQYVYTVTLHYDRYDHYSLGIADSLATAKAVAQTESDSKEDGEKGKPLHWTPREYKWRDNPQRYWTALDTYGHEYHIDRQQVITTREVP